MLVNAVRNLKLRISQTPRQSGAGGAGRASCRHEVLQTLLGDACNRGDSPLKITVELAHEGSGPGAIIVAVERTLAELGFRLGNSVLQLTSAGHVCLQQADDGARVLALLRFRYRARPKAQLTHKTVMSVLVAIELMKIQIEEQQRGASLPNCIAPGAASEHW